MFPTSAGYWIRALMHTPVVVSKQWVSIFRAIAWQLLHSDLCILSFIACSMANKSPSSGWLYPTSELLLRAAIELSACRRSMCLPISLFVHMCFNETPFLHSNYARHGRYSTYAMASLILLTTARHQSITRRCFEGSQDCREASEHFISEKLR